MAKAETVFGADTTDATNHEQLQQKLHAKIVQLTMEKDFLFSQCARAQPMSERKTMAKGNQWISVSSQCHLLAVPRASVYTRVRETSAADMKLMRQLDERYLQWPFYGSRRLCEELRHRGEWVNRKRVRRLMRRMGLRAVYTKPARVNQG